MNKQQIKVGFCVAYDWNLLRVSIPKIYEDADIICLSIDKNRQSWAGHLYSWDENAFRVFVKDIDKSNKIKIYEDVFYISSLTPMENEIRQRNLMAAFMDKGGWHIQLDADEYFFDFNSFVTFLQSVNIPSAKTNICCPWITLFKQIDGGYLVIEPAPFETIEFIPCATLNPHYAYGRRNDYFNLLAPYFILHQSWGRSEEQIKEKLNNWGHKNDFDSAAFFEKWKSLEINNYKEWKNFHPLNGELWSRLLLMKDTKIDDMLKSNQKLFESYLDKRKMKSINSIWISRFKFLKRKLTGKK